MNSLTGLICFKFDEQFERELKKEMEDFYKDDDNSLFLNNVPTDIVSEVLGVDLNDIARDIVVERSLVFKKNGVKYKYIKDLLNNTSRIEKIKN